MSEHAESPRADDVEEKLTELISGKLSREEASTWAARWLTKLEYVRDVKVRDALSALGGADLPSTDRPYLFGQEDFKRWLRDLRG